MNMITNLCPHRLEVDWHLTQNPSAGPKLRPLGRAPTTREPGRTGPGACPGRARASGHRGSVFPYIQPQRHFCQYLVVIFHIVYLAVTIPSLAEDYSQVHYMENHYEILEKVPLGVDIWENGPSVATGARAAWGGPRSRPPGFPCGRRPSQRCQLGS